MAIAITLRQYIESRDVPYEVLTHPHSQSSMETAQMAHVPGECLAKCVLLEDETGYVMAVLPSTHHVRLGALSKQMQRKLRLAREEELQMLFKDCELGAIPPLGAAYGIDMVVEESLAEKPEVWFEAGDHMRLIHMSGGTFMGMMQNAPRWRFSEHL